MSAKPFEADRQPERSPPSAGTPMTQQDVYLLLRKSRGTAIRKRPRPARKMCSACFHSSARRWMLSALRMR